MQVKWNPYLSVYSYLHLWFCLFYLNSLSSLLQVLLGSLCERLKLTHNLLDARPFDVDTFMCFSWCALVPVMLETMELDNC